MILIVLWFRKRELENMKITIIIANINTIISTIYLTLIKKTPENTIFRKSKTILATSITFRMKKPTNST